MDETRAVARLPNLEIEISHRRLPEANAEYLALSLKATPDLDAALAWLNPFRLALAFNPWLAAWWNLGRPLPDSRRPAVSAGQRIERPEGSS